MTQIDWSKAPEGATHYGPAVEGKWLECWHKNVNGEWLGWLADGDTRWSTAGNSNSRIKQFIPRPQEWNGSGLPPVGTVCEIDNGRMGWVECEIVAHKFFDCGSKPHAIAWIDANNIDQSQGNRFRPIRTPAQLAAEEREKASVELAGILAGHDQHIAVRDIEMAKYLYDTGYRKVEVQP